MDERIEWRIDDQPPEYQARYWRLRSERLEAQLKLERKRKEPETLREVEKELKDAKQTIEVLRKDIGTWKNIGYDAWERITYLENEGAAEVLRRERDHWQSRWRNCTRRLGNCIEHLGLDYTGIEPSGDEIP